MRPFLLVLAGLAGGCAAEAASAPFESQSETITLKRAYAIAIDSGTDASAAALNARWVGLVTVSEGQSRFRVQPCAVVSSKASGAKPLVPDEVLGALTPIEVAGRLDQESLEIDRVALLFGVRGLADPASDPLPGARDDGRIFDGDGDGSPGIRVQGPSGPVNVGMRVLVGLKGKVNRESGVVLGDAELTVESRVYDAPPQAAGRMKSSPELGYAPPEDLAADAPLAPPSAVQSAVRRFKLVPLHGTPTCRAANALVGVTEPARTYD
jgi:hypothetical protein